MRIAGIIENDIVDCDDGICVSLWAQGCPHHCKGCHNPETWDFNGGAEVSPTELAENIIVLLTKNGIKRNFSILGGEPLCPENIDNIIFIVEKIRSILGNNIKIYCWTGYTYEDLLKSDKHKRLFRNIDVLIDGQFDETQRDTTLKLRGSKNQRIIKLH